MTCPECQGTNDPDAIACRTCGASLDVPVSSPALPEGTPLHDGAYTVGAADRYLLVLTNQPTISKTIDTNINNNRAWLEVFFGNHFRSTNGHN